MALSSRFSEGKIGQKVSENSAGITPRPGPCHSIQAKSTAFKPFQSRLILANKPAIALSSEIHSHAKTYMKSPHDMNSFVDRMRGIVGPDNVIFHPEDLLVFEYDGSVDRGMPQAVVFPATTEQVSQVLSHAFQEGIPVVGRGSGTGLSGGVASAGFEPAKAYASRFTVCPL